MNNKMWDDLDFFLNKALWLHKGFEKSIVIRKKNLLDLKSIFDRCGQPFFLEGRTLENIFLKSELVIDDHDDDIGIFKDNETIIRNKILPLLEENGFRIIRNNSSMISILRDDRYIDICIFEIKNNNYIGYGKKLFPIYQYRNLDKIKFENKDFHIPSDTIKHLKNRYKSNNYSFENIKYFIYRGLKKYVLPILQYINSKKRIQLITEDEFLNLYIENPKAINWKLRKPHLDIVTNNGKYKKIKDIIIYLKANKHLLDRINETDMSQPFREEIHLDRRFWQTGNNYFIYCVKYQFRKNVIPYNKANKYIKEHYNLMLYSKDYFESLECLNDLEIKEFLEKYEIEITRGSISSGRHRTFAMIGRLINDKPYIPFYAKKLY